MNINAIRNGKFSLHISAEQLSKGLRRYASNPVNKDSLVICNGMIGREGVLQRLSGLVKQFAITSTFPFPQVFVETNLIIVCTVTGIYEFVNNDLELMYSVTGGSTWSLISSHDFVCLSNGIDRIVRDPISKTYSSSTDFPTANAMCNFNGQIIIGAPNAGYNLGD